MGERREGAVPGASIGTFCARAKYTHCLGIYCPITRTSVTQKMICKLFV